MTIQFTPGADCTIQVPIFDTNGAYATAYSANAADWRISVNGGAFGALTNTPTVAPAASGFVQVVIDSTETSSDGDRVTIKFDDSTNQAFAVHLHAANARATASALATVDGIVDDILVDTGTTLPATLATIDGIVDDILVDTGTTIPAAVAVVDGNVDSILEDTGTTLPVTLATIDANVDLVLEDTGTSIPATLATVSTHSAADVVTAMQAAADDFKADVSALATSAALATVDGNVDTLVSALAGTIAELTGSGDAPSTPTIKQALALLYMDVRNNGTVTASTRTVRNDAGSTVLSATVSDDGTTFSKGKLA